MKLLNSVASVLMCGELLAWLVHIHAIFHRYCTVHCKRMIPREDASITHMCILATLPVSCTVTGSGKTGLIAHDSRLIFHQEHKAT